MHALGTLGVTTYAHTQLCTRAMCRALSSWMSVYPPPDASGGCLSGNRASMTTRLKSDDHSGVLVHFPAPPFSLFRGLVFLAVPYRVVNIA
jgi:hypothetical protein